MSKWKNEFGREYTDRNSLSADGVDALYEKNYGVTRRQLNRRFLSHVPPTARILEVGCNIGNQLGLLQEMGYSRLFGIDLQHYALSSARRQYQNINLTVASALEIPFPDDYFDVVFTSGVLIHIAPSDLPRAMAEIYPCTREYVWGFEYYAPEMTEVQYRGHERLLWKMDYEALYLRNFPDLRSLRSECLRYVDNENQDCMFLLQKPGATT